MADKPTFDEFLAACVVELGYADQAIAESMHGINMRSALQVVQSSATARAIFTEIERAKLTYLGGQPDLLLYGDRAVIDTQILFKPFRSTIHKLYRHNVLFNRNYPKDPREGARKLQDIYSDTDDVFRTRIICKYMDGPRYLCEVLKEYCDSNNIEAFFRDLGTDAGYYAWHFYFRVPVDIAIGGGVRSVNATVEIQFSTQLAEAITVLTHGLYEVRREGVASADGKLWKWDAGSQEFRSAFLGHGLHLLEGIIQSFRDDVLRPLPGEGEAVVAEISSKAPSIEKGAE